MKGAFNLNNLTTGDLAFAGGLSGGAGAAVSFLVSHGLMGPLVSIVLFVLTTAARALINARAGRPAPAALTAAQVAAVIVELQKRGLVVVADGLDGRGQLASLIREKVNEQEK